MRGIFAVATLLVLAGCASMPPATATLRPAGAERAAYTINGRIAVKYDGERSSANLHWSHRTTADDILLLAPLGMTVAHLWRDADGAMLEASGKRYVAQDSSALMQQVLGWHLPLEGLPYWVLALPRPGAEADVERDANGQINLLRQDGWSVRYTRYAAQTPDSLPLRMSLRRERLEIVLLIDEWALQ
jgi:outer membrane lipoprotein LolB